MAIEPVNIVCMKWGTKYGADYVNKLHNMVERNLTVPHRFVCFTDDSKGLNDGIETFPLPEIEVPPAADISPWRKLALLGEKLGDLHGQSLFLDLDIIIIKNIDCFFAHPGKFCIIENWTQAGQGIGNSSVYRFEIGAHKDVYEAYSANPQAAVEKEDNEQIYLSKHIGAQGDLVYWPETWCRSFKEHCIPAWPLRFFKEPAIPEGAKIIVFHGYPHPEHAAEGKWPTKSPWRKRLYKYIRPTTWVNKFWH